jgi:hypothetical protein
MKTRALATMLAVAAVAACEPATYAHWQAYPITVEAIEHPEVVPVGEPFTIRFLGEAGPTSCHRFFEFVTETTPAQLEVALVGRFELNAGTQCVEVPTLLGPNESITVRDAAVGEYRIIVYQPNGTTLEGTVLVE